MKDFTATINEQSSRYADWMRVFGTNQVVLKSPLAHAGIFPGVGKKDCYDVDLAALTPAQRERMILHISERFDIPLEEVRAELDNVGMPILADDVIVTIHNPQRWL